MRDELPTLTRRQITEWAIPILFLVSVTLFIGGCGLPLKSRIDKTPFCTRWLPFLFPRPIAYAERPITYEGEEIWAVGVMPQKFKTDFFSDFIPQDKRVFAKFRFFGGNTELTDSVNGNPAALGLVPLNAPNAKPGDTLRMKASTNVHFLPGNYWGVLDAGVISKKFHFTVLPMPDSLSRIWELYVELGGIPKQHVSGSQYVIRFMSPEQQQERRIKINELACLLVAQPIGAPLRYEALQLCVSHSKQFRQDTLLWPTVIKQYLMEPRIIPRQALMGLCEFKPMNLHNDSAIQIATEWGGERMAEAVRQWRIR